MSGFLIFTFFSSKVIKKRNFFACPGAGGGAGLFPRRVAPPRPRGPPRLPPPPRPDGRQGHRPLHRRGGAHQAHPPHLRGGAQAQRGVLPPTQQAHHHLEHAPGFRQAAAYFVRPLIFLS
jgi:hypothetical protein